MIKRLHLIYVPGLGDSKATYQKRAISTWHLWGVEAELFQMYWADNEPWEAKFKGLLARIDSLTAEGKQIGLVGASAGATAVINAFAARKDSVVGCVLISGKVNQPETIGQRYRQRNPAFVTSAQDCQRALVSLTADDRKRILSRYALADETVYKSDSRIIGAHNQIVPSVGHAFTIATQIVFGVPGFVSFLKRLSSKV